MADDLSDSAKVLWLGAGTPPFSETAGKSIWLVRLLPYEALQLNEIGAQDSFESVISY